MKKVKVSGHRRKGKSVRQHDRTLDKGKTPLAPGKELAAKKTEPNDLRCPGGMCHEMAKGLMSEHADAMKGQPIDVPSATEHLHKGLKNSLAPQEFKKWVGSKKRVREHVLRNYGSIFGDHQMWGG